MLVRVVMSDRKEPMRATIFSAPLFVYDDVILVVN